MRLNHGWLALAVTLGLSNILWADVPIQVPGLSQFTVIRTDAGHTLFRFSDGRVAELVVKKETTPEISSAIQISENSCIPSAMVMPACSGIVKIQKQFYSVKWRAHSDASKVGIIVPNTQSEGGEADPGRFISTFTVDALGYQVLWGREEASLGNIEIRCNQNNYSWLPFFQATEGSTLQIHSSQVEFMSENDETARNENATVMDYQNLQFKLTNGNLRFQSVGYNPIFQGSGVLAGLMFAGDVNTWHFVFQNQSNNYCRVSMRTAGQAVLQILSVDSDEAQDSPETDFRLAVGTPRGIIEDFIENSSFKNAAQNGAIK